ncbi:MAG: PilZ domain-containing protein [Phycisphaerales bacterium]
MASADPGVIVRRARRFDVVLPASMAVGEAHKDIVQFGPRAGDRAGWIEGDLIDIGVAGAGFMGTTFMPRGARVVLRIFELGGRDGDPLLEIEGTIVRTVMTDRRPAYLLGIGFDAENEATKKSIDALIERFEAIASDPSDTDRTEPTD